VLDVARQYLQEEVSVLERKEQSITQSSLFTAAPL
jgi:hypothetical protein